MDDDALLRRISINPKVCGGRPCIKGHRIPVELMLDFLASGVSPRELCSKAYYPGVTLNDILACIAFGAQSVRSEELLFAEELAASKR